MSRSLKYSKKDLKTLFAIILFLFRNKALALLVLIIITIGYSYEIFYARPHATYAGIPQAQHWNLNSFIRVFRNHGFMLGYSEWRGSPLWVTYHLSEKPENTTTQKRPSSFKVDWRSIRRVSHDDYRKSGYDRGHMAPNYAIATLHGRQAQLDTFNMTNIVPQKPNLNRKLWQRLEAVEIDYFGQWFQSVWVVTGPIFNEKKESLSSSNVEIPDAFYKIYIQPGHDLVAPRVLAMVMPQNVRGNESLLKFVTTVDAIEEQTGLDFFSQLTDKIEQTVEASQDIVSWRLNEVANLASRY